MFATLLGADDFDVDMDCRFAVICLCFFRIRWDGRFCIILRYQIREISNKKITPEKKEKKTNERTRKHKMKRKIRISKGILCFSHWITCCHATFFFGTVCVSINSKTKAKRKKNKIILSMSLSRSLFQEWARVGWEVRERRRRLRRWYMLLGEFIFMIIKCYATVCWRRRTFSRAVVRLNAVARFST